jgi:hypothetical protein
VLLLFSLQNSTLPRQPTGLAITCHILRRSTGFPNNNNAALAFPLPLPLYLYLHLFSSTSTSFPLPPPLFLYLHLFSTFFLRVPIYTLLQALLRSLLQALFQPFLHHRFSISLPASSSPIFLSSPSILGRGPRIFFLLAVAAIFRVPESNASANTHYRS